MKIGDKIDIYEYKVHKTGSVNLFRHYICEIEMVSELPTGTEWSAYGRADEDGYSRHFKSYEIGKRYEGDVIYILEESEEKAVDLFVRYYERTALYFARKQIDAQKTADRIKKENEWVRMKREIDG